MATTRLGAAVMTTKATRRTIMTITTTMRMVAGTNSPALIPGTGTDMAAD